MLGFTIIFIRFILGWLYTLLVSSMTVLLMMLGMPKLGWLLTCRPWARGVLWIVGVRINLRGAENLAGPAIFISNHQSLIDVVFMPSFLPRRVRWIAKQELARIPVWGWGFGSSGAIFINRRHPRQAIESIRQGLDKLPPDWSIVIYPEGTRSKDGRLQRFKKGVFHIAMQSRLPVVPIGMWGARDIVPKGASVVRPGRVEVTVGAPICTDHWTADEVDLRMQQMRDAVARCVDASAARYQPAPGSTRGVEEEAGRRFDVVAKA